MNKRDKLKRILALVMVVLLALSVCTAAIYHLVVSLSASSVMDMTQALILAQL